MDALKFGIISLDATMKSNVSVGPPIDILCYENDSLQAKMRTRLDEDDPYLEEISRKWQDGIIKLVKAHAASRISASRRLGSPRRPEPRLASDIRRRAGNASGRRPVRRRSFAGNRPSKSAVFARSS